MLSEQSCSLSSEQSPTEFRKPACQIRQKARKAPQTIMPNISQETLAEIIGTTRLRVSHFMNKSRKLGLISYYGHIEVSSSLLDAVLHEKA
jgi:hypothetical protein